MTKRTVLIAAAAVLAVVLASITTQQRGVHRADLAAPSEDTITKALQDVPISDLAVRSVGDIVILRGIGDTSSAQHAVAIVKSLGVTRVANLINTSTFDDEAIRRAAERELARSRSLDGCKLRVHCQKGVLTVTGTVQHELQKDAARSALRAVRGAREVRVDLTL
ncbi:MAG TPA: BON domain-containing protein [Thermoanaerobaculia bacterium]